MPGSSLVRIAQLCRAGPGCCGKGLAILPLKGVRGRERRDRDMRNDLRAPVVVGRYDIATAGHRDAGVASRRLPVGGQGLFIVA